MTDGPIRHPHCLSIGYIPSAIPFSVSDRESRDQESMLRCDLVANRTVPWYPTSSWDRPSNLSTGRATPPDLPPSFALETRSRREPAGQSWLRSPRTTGPFRLVVSTRSSELEGFHRLWLRVVNRPDDVQRSDAKQLARPR